MNDIQDQAEYYQNLHIIDDTIKAVVMMENMEDEKFWDTQLWVDTEDYEQFQQCHTNGA